MRQNPNPLYGKRSRRESGQSLVEFAIAFPLQLLLVFGIMQMALLYLSASVVELAAFRCARAALVGEHEDVWAQWTVRAEDGGTRSGDYFTGVDFVAQTTLAPLAGPHVDTHSGTSGPPVVNIPGWGDIPRSDIAGIKVQTRVIEPDEENPLPADNTVTAVVEFNQELFFPFVDGLMRWVLRSDEDLADAPERQHLFGREDTEYRSLHSNDIALEEDTRGRVRMIGGKPHVVITRRCTLYRGAAIPYDGEHHGMSSLP